MSEKPQQSFVIAISGASGSGKSWFTEQLRQRSSMSCCVFDLDSYYRSSSWVETLEHRHDNPQSLDFVQAANDLSKLKKGCSVMMPEYDFERHQESGKKLCESHSLILVEGLFVFYDAAFRQLLDLKIWLEADLSLCLQRRIERDCAQRGRSEDEVLGRYQRDVKPGFEKFVKPYQRYADLTVANEKNNDKQAMAAIDKLLTRLPERREVVS